jgi:hypothetical protein
MDGIENVVYRKVQFKAADADEEVQGGMFDRAEDILFRALVKHGSERTSQRRALRKPDNPNEGSLGSILIPKKQRVRGSGWTYFFLHDLGNKVKSLI